MKKLIVFVKELRRRRVFTVAVVYAVVAWVVMQIGEVSFEALGIPDWGLSLVIVLAILFFPIAIVLGWAFDLTPRGVVRTSTHPTHPQDDRSAAGATGNGGPGAAGADASAMPAVASPARASRPRSSEPAIVVLPFTNLSPDPENEYFSDGISEELITQLSKMGSIRVISRTSAWRYKEERRSAGEIERELGVSHILEGSVRREGTRVRVTAQLVDAHADDSLWAETYDRELEGIFEIQSDLAANIANSLHAELSSRQRARIVEPPTDDLEAYDLYLKGLYFWNRRNERDLDLARRHFERAVRRDGSFALAHAGLANTYVTLAIYGALAPSVAMPRALEAAARALEREPDSAEALTARACVKALYEWKWEDAEREFEAAMSHNGQYATAHQWYAMNHLVPLGRFDAAEERLDAAASLDPLSPSVAASFGILHYFARRYDRAVAVFESVRADHPEFGLVHYFLGLARLGLGENERATADLARARELSEDGVEATTGLGMALAATGRADEARALLQDLRARRRDGYVSAARLAQIHALLGERDEALDRLERAVADRAVEVAWIDVVPAFDALRDLERFGSLRDAVLG